MNQSLFRHLRWGIYTRQSRTGAQEFASCDAQHQTGFDFIRAQIVPGWFWTAERYDDKGFSGDTLDRPALSRLREDIRAGNIDRVVVYRLDRLSRRLKECVQLLQEFREAGVALSVVTEPHIGTGAEHVLFLNVAAAFAEFEHDMIRDRLAESRAALKHHGRRVAGRTPYGYVADPKTKQLQIEPAEAEHVRLLFQWAAEGKTARQIASFADQGGWRTKPQASKSNESKPEGGRWTPRQVLETLANPTYAGLIRDGERVRPGCHSAIVPREQFEAAQRQVASRRTHSTKRVNVSERWALRGLLFCGQCERRMSPSISWHGPRGYTYYRCRSHAGGRAPCQGVCLPAYEIESFVLRETRSQFANLAESGCLPKDWDSLSLAAADAALSRLIRRVVFSKVEGKIRIEFREPDEQGGADGAA